MEFSISIINDQKLVYDAIRNGHILSLETYLNHNPAWINGHFQDGKFIWTPLIAACFYQNETIVRLLITRFKVDTDISGTVVFDSIAEYPEVLEDVSPLWISAALDNFQLVRLLIECGKANVNALAKNHITAFRAACFNNNLVMMSYLFEQGANPYQMKIGNFSNLMVCAGNGHYYAVKYLVEKLNSNINEHDENGQGALYYAVKSDSAVIVRYLLQHGAKNQRDSLRNVTPIMRAALYGKFQLVQAFQGYCSDVEWIEALELLGATFAGWITSIEDPNKTVEYLRQAFILRKEKNLQKQPIVTDLEIFNNQSECMTLDDFEYLVNLRSTHELLVETIRIQYRLLGNNSNDYHFVLYSYGLILANENRYDECFKWWFYQLELKWKFNIHVPREHLRSIVNTFYKMQTTKIYTMPYNLILRTLSVIEHELDRTQDKLDFNYTLLSLLYLISFIAENLCSSFNHNQSDFSGGQCEQFYQIIRKLIQKQYRSIGSGLSLLHFACSVSTNNEINRSLNKYPCYVTVRFILHCGANADVYDYQKNSPLHFLLIDPDHTDVPLILDLLRDYGVHSDYRNKSGLTPLEMIPKHMQTQFQNAKRRLGPDRLKCLCAKMMNEKPWSMKNLLANSLIKFIQRH